MPPPPVILLPPSEGKAPGGTGAPVDWDGGAFGALGPMRTQVRDALRRVIRRHADAARVLGVTGPHLERALAEWREIDGSPTMPAAQRYSGVVWGALDLPSLDAPARRRAMSRIVVPSGLWGLVAAGDLIPAYRLKMGARIPPMGLLAAWWRPHIAAVLAARARRGLVIDLLPVEHAAAIDPAVLRPGSYVRVEILEPGPGRRSVGHAGKAAKGRLARAIIEADARTAADIARVEVEGLGAAEVRDGEHPAVVRFRRSA